MKAKTLVAMAALALLIGVPARGAEVISSNIVGYNKITLNRGYNLLGVQFTDMGVIKDINTLGDSSAVPAFNQSDEVYDFQSTIRKWNGVGYDTYGWFGATDGTDVQGDDTLNNTWVGYESWNKEDVEFEKGMGFWIYVPSAATITIAGEVPSENSVTSNIARGYNLLCNPFPVALDIQDIQSPTGFAPFNQSDEVYDFQTTIRKWNGVGYDTYGWFGATDGTDVQGDDTLNNTWVGYESWNKEDVEFGVGEGFWLYSPTATNIRIEK